MRRSCSTHRRAELAAFALRMRHAPTRSEAALWTTLSGRRAGGVQFRRQYVLGGRWIADFAAPAARLVVEVDGGAHRGRERHDARRDRALAALGYRVLRLDAELVLRDRAAAVELVQKALGEGQRRRRTVYGATQNDPTPRLRPQAPTTSGKRLRKAEPSRVLCAMQG